jgi:hypothetical protein
MAAAVPTTAVEEADGGSSVADAQPKVNDMPPERVRRVEAGNAADLSRQGPGQVSAENYGI